MISLFCIIVFLTGCSSKNDSAKEYSVDEFSEIYWEISNHDSEEFSKLTDTEKWGDAKTDEEKTDHANPLHVKFQKEKMDEYDLKYNKALKIRGKVGHKIIGNNVSSLELLPMGDSDVLPIHIKMAEAIDTLEEGKVVIVEGEFLEDLAGKFPIMGNGAIISK